MKLDSCRLELRRILHEQPFFLGLIFFILGLFIHAPFGLYDCFGEQDAARLAVRAIDGNLIGNLKMEGHWPFSYPLYIHLLYVLLKYQWLSYGEMPAFMTILSLLSGSLFSAAFTVFILRTVKSLKVSVAAGVLLQFSPAFFFNSIYGFPTITALALFMTAAMFFQQGVLFSRTMKNAVLNVLFAAILFIIGVLFKIDVLLAAALFLIPVYQQQSSSKIKIIFSVGIALVCVFSFWLINKYGVLLSETQSANEHWSSWSDKFFGGLKNLFSLQNSVVISRAAGMLSIHIALVASIICFVCKRYRILVILIVATWLPILLFWGLVEGNSARHNLIPAVFVPILAALPLSFFKTKMQKRWTAVLLTVLLINYFAHPPSSSTLRPSGRLFESSYLLKERCRTYRDFGIEVANMENDKIFLAAPPYLLPYYYFEIIGAEHMTFKSMINIPVANGKYLELFMEKSGSIKTYALASHEYLALALEYADNGYELVYPPSMLQVTK